MDTPEMQQQEQDLPDELEVLKQRATLLGVPFSNNIGVDTLRQRIADKMRENDEGEQQGGEQVAEKNPLEDVGDAPSETVAAPVRKLSLRQHLYNTEMRLVRLRITNLDPKKKDLPGEILTVANEYLGTVRKFVPFGEVTDDGFHVEYCLYKLMEARRFLSIRTIKDRRTGHVRVESQMAKEFALEILPDLTPAELAKLANAQKAAGSID
jgi:hypothetical protein